MYKGPMEKGGKVDIGFGGVGGQVANRSWMRSRREKEEVDKEDEQDQKNNEEEGRKCLKKAPVKMNKVLKCL